MDYIPTYRPKPYQKAYEDYVYAKMKMLGELFYKNHSRKG